MKIPFLSIILLLSFFGRTSAQDFHLQNPYGRAHTLLNGNWHYVIDPYDTGYRNHRNWKPFDEVETNKASAKPYYTNTIAEAPGDRVEYHFDSSPTMHVPGDWNHQSPALEYYEGAIWLKTDFQAPAEMSDRQFLYFGAANYRADVYLNGEKIGFHEGGFSPFCFEVTGKVLKNNFLIVRVDNQRENGRVPNLTTDWWNYGGLTRDVMLVTTPGVFIKDYYLYLHADNNIIGMVETSGGTGMIEVEIAEAGLRKTIDPSGGKAEFTLPAKNIKRWFPERPKRYTVKISVGDDVITDEIGFRTIEARGEDILLNGQSIFLRGISLHEENPLKAGRVSNSAETKMLFDWAAELNCNFIRLAHYPHSEYAARLADEMGFLLWEEIPVYWGIDYENEATLANAQAQIRELVLRDRNRASVIVWSLANETPVMESRTAFLKSLKNEVLKLDNTRMISAALERDERPELKVMHIPDPFSDEVDLLSCNEYIGWYGSTPEYCREVSWDLTKHNKPFFVSEFGGGALYGHRGDSLERWTEDYQAYLYREQLKMLQQIPSLRGMTPWILVDFRSPRRNLPIIQDGWNRKGLLSNTGFKKQAFDILKAYYDEIEKKYPLKIKE